MIKSIIKPEDWEELKRVLRKHQIGYTISYDAHGKDHREMLIVMNPIGVQYYDDKWWDSVKINKSVFYEVSIYQWQIIVMAVVIMVVAVILVN